jgi:mannose-1-phosphate guanylyltransferase
MKILIMAGGSGERFWPLSTKERPKQLLPLISDKTMIRETVERLIGFVEFKDIYIATNELQYLNVMKELPEIPGDNIIVEPAFRDTAAAILYGSSYIASRNGENSIITVLASDHLITKKQKFIDALEIANRIAKLEDKIVTLGIKPTYPETGYGYLKVNNHNENIPNYNVSFVEKPNIENAKNYLLSGNYLWNSGMFIYKYKTLISNFELYSRIHLDILKLMSDNIPNYKLLELTKLVKDDFPKFPKISIDFAVMEKSNDVVCIPIEIGWSDIGSFDSLMELMVQNGNNFSKGIRSFNHINSNNNLILSFDSELDVNLIEISNSIIIKDKNKLLIIKKGSSSIIKNLLKLIEDNNHQ